MFTVGTENALLIIKDLSSLINNDVRESSAAELIELSGVKSNLLKNNISLTANFINTITSYIMDEYGETPGKVLQSILENIFGILMGIIIYLWKFCSNIYIGLSGTSIKQSDLANITIKPENISNELEKLEENSNIKSKSSYDTLNKVHTEAKNQFRMYDLNNKIDSVSKDIKYINIIMNQNYENLVKDISEMDIRLTNVTLEVATLRQNLQGLELNMQLVIEQTNEQLKDINSSKKDILELFKKIQLINEKNLEIPQSIITSINKLQVDGSIQPVEAKILKQEIEEIKNDNISYNSDDIKHWSRSTAQNKTQEALDLLKRNKSRIYSVCSKLK